MSDTESVSSASSPNLVDMLNEIRDNHKKMDSLLKEAEKMSKKVKVRARKPAGEKKPRKMSEGQLRWQAFQKFVWAEMKKENPTTIYKEAMRTAGEWKKEGYLNESSKSLAKFEAWLKENPIPTEEERQEAKQKAAAAKTKTKARSAESAAAAEEAAVSDAAPATPAKKGKAAAVPAAANPETPKKTLVAATQPPPAPKKAAGRPKKA